MNICYIIHFRKIDMAAKSSTLMLLLDVFLNIFNIVSGFNFSEGCHAINYSLFCFDESKNNFEYQSEAYLEVNYIVL